MDVQIIAQDIVLVVLDSVIQIADLIVIHLAFSLARIIVTLNVQILAEAVQEDVMDVLKNVQAHAFQIVMTDVVAVLEHAE